MIKKDFTGEQIGPKQSIETYLAFKTNPRPLLQLKKKSGKKVKQAEENELNKAYQRNIQLEKFKKQLICLSREDVGVVREMSPWDQTKTFISATHKYRFYLKKLVARAFVDRGYGVDNLMKEIIVNMGGQSMQIALSVDQAKYNIIIRSILTEAVRKLEMFLLQQCQHVFEKLSIQELSKAFHFLLHCHNKLEEKENYVLLGIVRVLYDIKKNNMKDFEEKQLIVRLTEMDSLRLYIKIRSQIEKGPVNNILSQTKPIIYEPAENKKSEHLELNQLQISEQEFIDLDSDDIDL